MSKEIFLTKGQRSIVDDDDYEQLLSMGPWCATERKSASTGRHLGFYATKMSYSDGKKTIYMHTIIAGLKRVTHLNGNTLDNQKKNLSKIDQKTVGVSRIKKQQAKCSKYKGVRKTGRMKRWEARIKHLGKQMLIGYFETEMDAAKAYDEAARELFGKFASLNFPSKGERDFGRLKKLSM